MPQAPQTSFIPKQTPGVAPRRQRRIFNVLSFAATVVFLASLAIAGFVFFYGKYVDDKLDEKKEELARLKSSFSNNDVASIRALERRLNAADRMLGGHISLSKVFDALEMQTQSLAQFESFSYVRLPSGAAEIELGGTSPTFNTVALQERRFDDERIFKDGSIYFSDLNVIEDEKGDSERVVFTVSAALDRSSILYSGTADVMESEVNETVTDPTSNVPSDDVPSEEDSAQ